MNEQIQGEFLRKRMIELREKNGISQSDMADKLFVNKSTLSRVEGGSSGYKTIHEFAEKYWAVIYDTEGLLRAIISPSDKDRYSMQQRLKKQAKHIFLFSLLFHDPGGYNFDERRKPTWESESSTQISARST